MKKFDFVSSNSRFGGYLRLGTRMLESMIAFIFTLSFRIFTHLEIQGKTWIFGVEGMDKWDDRCLIVIFSAIRILSQLSLIACRGSSDGVSDKLQRVTQQREMGRKK